MAAPSKCYDYRNRELKVSLSILASIRDPVQDYGLIATALFTQLKALM